MPSRTTLALALAALIAILSLAACAPSATPAPTPTPAFASEEEAFAAAEKTYRAFTAAVNEVDTTDPSTFEPLFELSTGEFEKVDREAYSRMHAERQVIDGDIVIRSFEGAESRPPHTSASASVCLDVSAVTIVGPDGASLVNPARPDVYGLTVSFVADRSRMLIEAADLNEDLSCEE